MKVALTIGRSDPSGDFGIVRDLAVFRELGVSGLCSMAWVGASRDGSLRRMHSIPPMLLGEQIDSAARSADLRSVKVGAIGRGAAIETVAGRIIRRALPRIVADVPLFDPSGRALVEPKAIPLLLKRLFPQSEVIVATPAEARRILCRDLSAISADEVMDRLSGAGVSAAIQVEAVRDEFSVTFRPSGGPPRSFPPLPCRPGEWDRLRETLSAALTARLAQGDALPDAVEFAYHFIMA